jgi:hypothetical protein
MSVPITASLALSASFDAAGESSYALNRPQLCNVDSLTVIAHQHAATLPKRQWPRGCPGLDQKEARRYPPGRYSLGYIPEANARNGYRRIGINVLKKVVVARGCGGYFPKIK